jgi:hypothetical protein
MKNLRVIFTFASVLLPLLLFGCGEEEISTIEERDTASEDGLVEIEEEFPEPGIPEHIEKVLDKLERGIEEEDVDLYLEAFWDDDYSYRSDMTTDDPVDDVVFEDIQRERESAQRLFAKFGDFEIKFDTKEFVEVDRAKVELGNHYQLLTSINIGLGLPGGHSKVFAEGDNTFTFRKRGDKWRVSRWEQEEMSVEEVKRARPELLPPEGALIQTWGGLKAGFGF